jgi:hypothetical protein
MSSASWALQQAIFARLTADAPLIALLGGARVYDDVPQAAAFPYLTFGQSTARDWSTGSDDGNEHILTLHVWSQANGKRQAHEIMGAVRTALHDQPLILDGPDVVRTLSSSIPSLIYTAADQTADFGAPRASVSLRVHQLSPVFGRGSPHAATV